ncbi:MAG: nucleotidyltransferase [Cytophagaceae bacterium]|nr:nucleotidyltransferase [Cytophagaceae bacterium]
MPQLATAQPIDATERFMAFRRLMQMAGRFYRANPNNPPLQMDIGSDDVQNLLRRLNSHGVRYLLVGGVAGMFHGHTRTTQDLDLWIERGEENRQHLIDALREADVVGAEALRQTPLLFGWTSVRFGSSNFELDLGETLKAFDATDFTACYQRSVQAELDGVPFRVIHLSDLLREKRSLGRAKDLADLEELEKIAQRRSE